MIQNSIENPTDYLLALRNNRVKTETVRSIEQLETPVLLHPIKTIPAQEAIEGKVGTQIVEGYGGADVLSSYAPLDIEGVNWGIISEISLSEAYEPIDSLQNYLLLSIIILILLVTLLAAIAARRFTRPLDLMVEGLRNSDTDGVAELDITSQDEFNELAQILNTIGRRTRTLNTAIAKRDREREKLLSNILPSPVIKRWQNGEQIVDRAQVTIIAIRVGGLEKANQTEATIAKAFNELITTLDNKAEQADVERLNCFGESYIAACGLTKPRLDRVKRGVDFAQDALNIVKDINRQYNLSLNLRIGIDTGLITAAVIGETKFCYDLWGEPVNVATQLAQRAEANTIRVTQAVNTNVEDMFAFESDNSVTLLDKRSIPTWVLGKTRMSDLLSDITSGLNLDFDNNSNIEDI